MKFVYFVTAVTCMAVVLGSCKKESLSNSIVNSTTSAFNEDDALLQTNPVRYGADIVGPRTIAKNSQNDVNFQTTVADQLGVTCLRETVLVPNYTSNTVPMLNSGYKILLHFNSPGQGNKTVPFRTDTVQYKKDLLAILKTFTVKPVVAMIENEESNRFYYSGSAKDYIMQLQAGITVMHNHGIKVANGGITNQGLNLLVYNDLLKQDKTDSAEQFKNLTHTQPDSASTQNRAAFIDTLLKNYRNMNIDFVNFHWKDSFPSTQALNQAINYLRKRTQKKVFSTEIGALIANPTTVTTHVQLCTDQHFPYIIWYSPDTSLHLRGTPLQNPDATLTASGYAYQSFIAAH